ncbi:hypothetical protein K1719_028534 [Acacia pycnantha]|nr:hypothetical protein K1719_040713 [Acacia pycnantha]KAI9090681.1 hypothetical protein K1719_028534 [Acacia pycnantha]
MQPFLPILAPFAYPASLPPPRFQYIHRTNKSHLLHHPKTPPSIRFLPLNLSQFSHSLARSLSLPHPNSNPIAIQTKPFRSYLKAFSALFALELRG